MCGQTKIQIQENSMATAVFIRSESADYYLYNFKGKLSEPEASKEAAKLCPEDRECWCDFMIAYTEE